MRTYYVYKATNKLNGKLYIGCTCDFNTRVWQHLRCYEKEDCAFHRAIQYYGKENFVFEVIEKTTSECESVELEKKYIKEFNTRFPNGYNMNDGGVGGHNSRPIVRLDLQGNFIKRYDSSAQAEKEDGFCNSDVLISCKNKHRLCQGYMFMFEDEYIKHGAREYKKTVPHNITKIVQCDLQGNYIRTFNSVNEASKETSIQRTRISSCVTGQSKTASNFIFVYEKDFPIKDISKYVRRKKGRKVAQIDINTGKIINTFERISEAGQYLGKNYKVIHKVVDNPDKTAYGFKWISIS